MLPHAASGWRIHCGVEVTELSTNKQHTLSLLLIDQMYPFSMQNESPSVVHTESS